MKKLLTVALQIAVLAAQLVSPAQAAPGVAVQSDRTARMETRIVDRINQVRAEHQLKKLASSSTLTMIARKYAHRMATEDFFSHYDPSGDSVAERVTQAGMDYRLVGENIFKSFNIGNPVEPAVNQWMQSPGHRKNILTGDFTETGVGIWKEGDEYRIVQVFMKPME